MGVEVVGGVLPSRVSLACTPAAGRVMLEPSLIRPASLKNIQWLPLSAGPKHSLKDGIPGPPQTALPAAPVPQERMERWSLFSQLLFLCLFKTFPLPPSLEVKRLVCKSAQKLPCPPRLPSPPDKRPCAQNSAPFSLCE